MYALITIVGIVPRSTRVRLAINIVSTKSAVTGLIGGPGISEPLRVEDEVIVRLVSVGATGSPFMRYAVSWLVPAMNWMKVLESNLLRKNSAYLLYRSHRTVPWLSTHFGIGTTFAWASTEKWICTTQKLLPAKDSWLPIHHRTSFCTPLILFTASFASNWQISRDPKLKWMILRVKSNRQKLRSVKQQQRPKNKKAESLDPNSGKVVPARRLRPENNRHHPRAKGKLVPNPNQKRSRHHPKAKTEIPVLRTTKRKGSPRTRTDRSDSED